MHKPTVFIADDHMMIVDAFLKLLEPTYTIVGTVTDGLALLERAPELRPDVVIIDIGMPRLNGLAAGQRLKQIMPRSKIIYVTMNEDGDLASEALRSGASAYLLKSCAGSELLKALHEALRGGTYVTPLIKQAMEESFIRSPTPKGPDKKLTPRQVEVLQLLAEGRLMKEVAAVLGLTPRTIAFHKYRIMETFRIHSNAELIRFAVKNHILPS
ncbi:MAG TPA: response regulator transcription factor [Candidatus Angelobacter sp.]|nr:response regulator transcription factor [Candidatus Angelobacter sp.]